MYTARYMCRRQKVQKVQASVHAHQGFGCRDPPRQQRVGQVKVHGAARADVAGRLAASKAGRWAGRLRPGAGGALAARSRCVRRQEGHPRLGAGGVARRRQKRVVPEVKRKGVRRDARVVCQRERERGAAVSHTFASVAQHKPCKTKVATPGFFFFFCFLRAQVLPAKKFKSVAIWAM